LASSSMVMSSETVSTLGFMTSAAVMGLIALLRFRAYRGAADAGPTREGGRPAA